MMAGVIGGSQVLHHRDFPIVALLGSVRKKLDILSCPYNIFSRSEQEEITQVQKYIGNFRLCKSATYKLYICWPILMIFQIFAAS